MSSIQQYSNQNPKGNGGQETNDSCKAASSLTRKADAVLKEETLGRSNQNTELISGGLNPNPDLEPTLELLRQQAYTLVDTFMKVLKERPEQLAQIASQFASSNQVFNGNDFLPFPLLKVPSPVNPGQAGHIDITIINDDPQRIAEYALHTTDLVAESGHKISATQIDVSPNPSRVLPGESIDGQIEIRVPPGAPPGTYSGLLQTDDTSQGQTVIQVTVPP
jgi:hypothetical protein